MPHLADAEKRTVAPLTVFLSAFLSVSPAGYPCALVYRRFLFYQPATVIHLFHALSGLALAAFNFGEMKWEIMGLCYYSPVIKKIICKAEFLLWCLAAFLMCAQNKDLNRKHL